MGAELLQERENDIPPVLRKYSEQIRKLEKSPTFQGLDLPHGNGQPVFLYPGLYEGDKELVYIAKFLRTLGYSPESSGIGINLGQPWQQEFMRKKVHGIVSTHGNAYIVGHSLGGFGGAQIAQYEPGVEKVIAIASPFIGGIDSANTPFMESIYSSNDGVVKPFMSKFKGPHTKNVEVFSPEHIEHVCHEGTFREIGFALAA